MVRWALSIVPALMLACTSVTGVLPVLVSGEGVQGERQGGSDSGSIDFHQRVLTIDLHGTSYRGALVSSDTGISHMKSSPESRSGEKLECALTPLGPDDWEGLCKDDHGKVIWLRIGEHWHL